ncbi:MAG TPA: LysM peptidoglycan-binding domain-containing protein [Candidatus Tetragenococcus pullicola]|nr:LysM peptidoglycan-binding domain-containing protein [Candidatus Tetragenococcus pullicola]
MKRVKLLTLTTVAFLGLAGFGSKVSADEVEHVVTPTDTLSGISVKYFGSTDFIDKIAEDNEIENPNLIFDGEKLTINTDKKKTTSKSETSEEKTTKQEATKEKSVDEKESSNQPSGKTITMESTAYSAQEGGTLTATGQDLLSNPRAIAVDPSVIPLGTRLYVEGYGEAVAVDTGGAIKGNIIDVHFPTIAECENWGRRQVQVTILD